MMAIILFLPPSMYGQQRAVTDFRYGLLPYQQTTEVYEGKALYRQIPQAYHDHPEFGKKPYNCKVDSAFELIHQRTINTRTLVRKGSRGKRLYQQKVYGKFHYKDNEGWWRTIDPRLRPTSDGSRVFMAPDQPVPVKVDLDHNYTSLELIDGYEFRFNNGIALKAVNAQGKVIYSNKQNNLDDYWYGTNGVINNNFWPGIDREVLADRGKLKTNFILAEEPSFIEEGGFLVLEDSIVLPHGYELKEKAGKGYHNHYGDWHGKLQLLNDTGKEIALIDPLLIYDRDARVHDSQPQYPAGYRLMKMKNGYKLQIRIASAWLQDIQTKYPLKIDPFVYGSDTFQKKTMGYTYDPFYDSPQGGTINYCPYFMTVEVPGRSELTRTWAEFESQSYIGGCPTGSSCEKLEQRFRLLQPCANISFYCPDDLNLPGICTTETRFPVDTIMDCLDAQCPPHQLDFELRLYHGSCSSAPDCDTMCHRMFSGTWIMTIEARRLEGNISAKAPYCKGDTVKLTANASWGVPPYNYKWLHNGDTNRITYVTPTTDTTFICRIRDSCSLGEYDSFNVVYDTIHLTVRDNPDITTSATDATCKNGEDGSVIADVSSSGAPFTYEWSTEPPANSSIVDSVPVGQYHVTVTDKFGCDSEDSVEVGFVNLLEVSSEVDDISCYGAQDGRISIDASGSPPYIYEWSTGDTTAVLDSLGPGSYHLTITDDRGCIQSDTIALEQPDSFEIDAGIDQTLIEGETAQLLVTVSGDGQYLYAWMPAADLNDPSLPNPTASPDSTTIYTVAVSDLGQPDCDQLDSVLVEVLRRQKLYVPTAFTPNKDGVNDIFVPKGEGHLLSMQIFDRWGNLVYEGTDGWDGTVNGVPQPIGTYVYMVRYRMVQGGEIKFEKGNLTLIR